MKLGAVLIAAAMLVGAGVASAAEITRTFTITARDFIPYYGSTPIDPLVGAFTVTFDPAVETDPTSVGITVKSSNFPTLVPEFTYLPQFDLLDIGTKPTLGGGFLTNQDGDYGFLIGVADPRFILAQYIALDGTGEYYSQTGTVAVSSAPEPAAWALWIVAMGLAGAALRGRREEAVAA
jgi:MYXO-CTERM domain-containing protein